MTNPVATVLEFHKETDNKLRWDAHVDDTVFEFYVPKAEVPEPWPRLIRVTVEPFRGGEQEPRVDRPTKSYPIDAIVQQMEEKTKTVRYQPRGDQASWQIGEPYIPTQILESFPGGLPRLLRVVVEWI